MLINRDCLYYTLYSVIFKDPFHMFQAIQVQRVTAAEDYDEIPRKYMYHFPHTTRYISANVHVFGDNRTWSWECVWDSTCMWFWHIKRLWHVKNIRKDQAAEFLNIPRASIKKIKFSKILNNKYYYVPEKSTYTLPLKR